ncbi:MULTISPECIES: Ppx/GppA phosphatase family protein [Kordiimonas]|uniref:Ppx/GppA phosphatase family protein n=1 Tax=Kordiimonas TaxID=288021 RepID=UPI002580D0AC|nr:hypothetical protein [Kordiimonas sp. UBA4487]
MSLDPQAPSAGAAPGTSPSGGQAEHQQKNSGKKRRPRRRRRGTKGQDAAQAKGPGQPQAAPAKGQGGSRQPDRPARPAQPSAAPAKKQTGRQPQPPLRGVYSAIDLGTNNCRLLIARPTRGGFRVIDAFSRIVRLGEGVSSNNRLSDEAMDRTIEALKVCAEKIARRGVTCMRHVATEACRVADNSDEFIARVKRETGINLDVISAGEEARLAVMGCQSLIAPGNRNALVFDIGGGSTELIWVRVHPGQRTEISGWMSIPWGVVNLSESFGRPGETLPIEHYNKMVKLVVDHLQAFEDAHQVSDVVRKRKTQFLGTSGTVTTLASLHLNLPRYIREKVDGAWMKSQDIHALSRRVATMTHDERAAQVCIGPERADLVVAGCAILEAILGMWKVPSLRVADRGIREGILRGLMQMEQPPRRARPLYRGDKTQQGDRAQKRVEKNG